MGDSERGRESTPLQTEQQTLFKLQGTSPHRHHIKNNVGNSMILIYYLARPYLIIFRAALMMMMQMSEVHKERSETAATSAFVCLIVVFNALAHFCLKDF